MTQISETHLKLQQAQLLVAQKDAIEKDIQDQESILRAQNVDMKTPLIDNDGFPRADLDIYQITHARAALAKLYNDLKAKMNEVQLALEAYHASQRKEPIPPNIILESPAEIPFARVQSVLQSSPAQEAGLNPGDLIYRFGEIDYRTANPLQQLGGSMEGYKYKTVRVNFIRDDKKHVLLLVPKPWSGRGLLGCHLLPL